MIRNHNSWSVQVSYSAFSVFAASHYVPTNNMNETLGNQTVLSLRSKNSTNGKQGMQQCLLFTYNKLILV